MIYDITTYGAVGDGKTNDRAAIQQAIDDCSAAGGGLVLVPTGAYLTSTIQLKSNVELHFQQGATLLSSLDSAHFDQDPEKCHILGALHAKNVAVTGFGVIDGRGRETNIFDNADGGLNECPLAFAGFRPRTTLFEDVDDLVVRDITLRDSAAWALHLAGCRNVVIDGIRIENEDRGAGNDGIDPDCCQNVTISNCHIFTGDDAVVVKTTKEMAALYGPCENITITGCVLHSRDSAFKIGTETWGDIRNIIFANNVAYDCSRIVGIWMRDGAVVENIQISNIIGSCRRYADANRYPDHWWGKGESLFISNTFRNKDRDVYTGTIRDVFVKNVIAKSESSFFIKSGGSNCPIENIYIEDSKFSLVRQGTQKTGLFDESPAFGGSKFTKGNDFIYPDEIYPHSIPAIYAHGVHRLFVRDCDVRFGDAEGEAWANVAQIEACSHVRIARVAGKAAVRDVPAYAVTDCANVVLDDLDTEGTPLLEANTDFVVVRHCDSVG